MTQPSTRPTAGQAQGRLPYSSLGTAADHARPCPWHALLSGHGRVEALERYATLVGRILISQIFLISGLQKILDWSGNAELMASRGMFAVPLFLAGAILVEVGGGLSLLLGFRSRLGALLLFLFLIPTTLIFHSFWTEPPDRVQIQSIMFMKNLAIMGGLLLLAGFGAGPLSLDERGRRPA